MPLEATGYSLVVAPARLGIRKPLPDLERRFCHVLDSVVRLDSRASFLRQTSALGGFDQQIVECVGQGVSITRLDQDASAGALEDLREAAVGRLNDGDSGGERFQHEQSFGLLIRRGNRQDVALVEKASLAEAIGEVDDLEFFVSDDVGQTLQLCVHDGRSSAPTQPPRRRRQCSVPGRQRTSRKAGGILTSSVVGSRRSGQCVRSTIATMKIGCQMAFNDLSSPSYIAAAGSVVEAMGFHSLWVPEHVLFFPEYESRYPYSEDGKLRGDPRSLIDPFSALTFVAANTSRIRLGTGICLVPQRNPVYTARQVSDIDYLSGGRFDFGIGIGWLKEEFEALGVPWGNRAGRTLECIDVMKTLWSDEVSKHEGERFRIEAAYQNPKPVQKPHPPLFFGGESDPALQRVATVGQGWFGYNLTPSALEERLAKLDQLLAAAGRSRSDVEVYAAPAPEASHPDDLGAFASLGVDQVIFFLFANQKDDLERRAEKVLSLVA